MTAYPSQISSTSEIISHRSRFVREPHSICQLLRTETNAYTEIARNDRITGTTGRGIVTEPLTLGSSRSDANTVRFSGAKYGPNVGARNFRASIPTNATENSNRSQGMTTSN